ncbi:MAG: tetratricopeptide repeat protein [Bryobacteraceae bacterium]|nr:tetratricopeptide repeat protein [Bryobacteraceae bacterium]
MRILAGFVCALVVGAQEPTSWEELRAKGRTALDNGQFGAAYPLLREALDVAQYLPKTDGRYFTSLRDMAELSFALGRYDEAEPHLRLAVFFREQQVGKEHLSLYPDLEALGYSYYARLMMPEAA